MIKALLKLKLDEIFDKMLNELNNYKNECMENLEKNYNQASLKCNQTSMDELNKYKVELIIPSLDTER